MSDYWKEVDATSKTPDPAGTKEVLLPLNSTLIKRARNGAAWTWWISGLSVVNIVLALLNSIRRFAFGFEVTDVIYAVGHASGPVLTYVALAVDAGFLGFMVFLGFQGRKLRPWAFLTAIVLLVLDGGVLFWMAYLAGEANIAGLAFHLLAITFLGTGLQAAKILNERKKAGKA